MILEDVVPVGAHKLLDYGVSDDSVLDLPRFFSVSVDVSRVPQIRAKTQLVTVRYIHAGMTVHECPRGDQRDAWSSEQLST